MSFLSKWWRQRLNGVTLVILFGFVAFVFFLLYSNYRAATELHQAFLDRLAGETRRCAAAFDHFLDERRSDVANLTRHPELTGYFTQRALGNTKVYGLGLSLSNLRTMLQGVIERPKPDGQSIYRRLMVLDETGTVLADVAPAGVLLTNLAAPRELLAPTNREAQVEFRCDPDGFRISQACYEKDQYVGQVLAWVDPKLLFTQLSFGDTTLPHVLWLDTDLVRVVPPAHHASPLTRLRLAPAGTNHATNQIVSLASNGRLEDFAVFRVPLATPDASLVAAYGLATASGPFSHGRMLTTMTLLAAVVLAGAFIIVLLNTRSLLLKVRLDESLVRQGEIERNNRRLEDEVRERNRVETALSRSERNYREIFNATSEAIFIHGAEDGRILDVNRAMLEMFGRRPDEVSALIMADISCDEEPFTAPAALARIRQASSEGPQLFEWKARKADGTCFWVEVALRRTEIGGEGRVLAAIRDITERKHAQEERERLEVQLRQSQKMQAVGQLAGGVAHDFNNLLQVIQGNVDLALEDLGQNHPVGENLGEVRGAAERAAALVRQLLTFSRRVPLKQEYLDPEAVILDLAKMLRRLIGEHIEMDIQTVKPLRMIHADRSQLEQIFVNLCVNARDAMPEGGRLTIRAETSDTCPGDVGRPPSPLGYVRLTISDTGNGIPVEIQDRVFEPFFTTKDVGKGTGLGLSTVYSIVQNHEGHIQLLSAPGRGTSFIIHLPAKPRPALPGPIRPAPARPPIGTGQTILLAEDEAMVRDLAVRVLERAGYRVLVARDGEEAMIQFGRHEQEIDLALLDVVMPRMNGSAVFQAIKERRPQLTCVLTTGYSFDTLERSRIPADTSILQKPYRPDELLRHVHQMLHAELALLAKD